MAEVKGVPGSTDNDCDLLCPKPFRGVIELMTELGLGRLSLTGGCVQTRIVVERHRLRQGSG